MGRYRPPRPAGSPYITPRVRKRCGPNSRLWKVERPEVTKAVSAAAALATAQKRRLYLRQETTAGNRLPGAVLRKRLDALQVVDGPLGDRNKAWFGAWVTLEDDEAEQVWRIVGPDEFDVSQGKISCDSPLGSALLGQPVGSDIQLETPKGTAIGHWSTSNTGKQGFLATRRTLLTIIPIITSVGHVHLYLQRRLEAGYSRGSMRGREICRRVVATRAVRPNAASATQGAAGL